MFESRLHNRFFRVISLLLGLSMISAVYTLQHDNILKDGLYSLAWHPNAIFIMNKTARLLINDFACLLIIWAVFAEKKYLAIGWYLFVIELVVILPIYFLFKLTLEGDSEISSPLLSQIHRLVVNPVLMFLLIVGFVYQRMRSRTVIQ